MVFSRMEIEFTTCNDIILLISDFFRVVDVSKMRIILLLLRNLQDECLLCTIYWFSRCRTNTIAAYEIS
jgi:hypothetical protein